MNFFFGQVSNKLSEHIVCLPVPEKNQRQFNICVIPQYADGINTSTRPESEPALECMGWTIPDGPAKTAFSGTGQPLSNSEDDKAEKLVRGILNDELTQTKVTIPDAGEFVSAVPEPHRKTEKAYHVKAFRGSKEGELFIDHTMILFY